MNYLFLIIKTFIKTNWVMFSRGLVELCTTPHTLTILQRAYLLKQKDKQVWKKTQTNPMYVTVF